MQKIFLLVALAAAFLAPEQPELPAGSIVDVTPEDADKLITAGTARLATADDIPPPAVKPEKAGRQVRVRLLCDGAHGNANDVVDLPAGIAKQLDADGQADADKAAVAYALTLPQNADKN